MITMMLVIVNANDILSLFVRFHLFGTIGGESKVGIAGSEVGARCLTGAQPTYNKGDFWLK